MKLFKKDNAGVSPVIATLVLVLVAVAAGVAFYAWQSSWQEENTSNVNSINAENQLTISGSTTVYEWTAVAAPLFEEEYPSYQVHYAGGGSTAGKNSIGKGLVDIGSASSYMSQSYFDDYPDLNQDGKKDTFPAGTSLVEHVVAYDAIAPVVSTTNTHGLVDVDQKTMVDIYGIVGWDNNDDKTILDYVNLYYSGGVYVGNSKWDGASMIVLATGGTITTGDYLADGLDWDEVPKTVAATGTVDVSVAGATTLADGNYYINYGATYGGWQYITVATGTATPVPTGAVTGVEYWEVCDNSNPVKTSERLDRGGTEEAFGELMLGKPGGKKYMEDIGIESTLIVASNQDLVDAIGADSDVLGFMSAGIAQNTDDVEIVPYTESGSAGVELSDKAVLKGDYDAVRPIIYITIDEPTGAAKLFIDFVKQPEINRLLAEETGYVSIVADQ